jgi:FkbH-like protein
MDAMPMDTAATPMDAAEFLFPTELRVRDTGIRRVLIIGSCMAQATLREFRDLAPQVSFDWTIFNNVMDLPALDDQALQSIDVQYIQLSLRHVVSDDIVNFAGFLEEGAAEALLARSRQMLALMLHAALKYNRSHRLLTFVANFLVPQVPVVAALNHTGSIKDFSTLVRALNQELAALVLRYQNVYLADIDQIGNALGKRHFLEDVVGFYAHAAYWGPADRIYETSADYNAPLPGRIDPLPHIEDVYGSKSAEYFAALWAQIEAMYRTINQIDMVKLVIFDLDDTLWRGQIAEHYADGAPTPVLYGWPVGMWEAVQHLRARGIITAICSKNDEGLVRARWGRAVLPWLTPDDFALRAINFRPKADNVAKIIAGASITARSTVFVDDNPVEREAVRAAHPGIRVIGSNPYVTRRILLWSPETQLAFRSAESANREQSIRQLQLRESERSTMSREEFLASLGCCVSIGTVPGEIHPDFARSLELINKTNQFNTTGVRWTSTQLVHFLTVGGDLLTFRVRDRYADYGLVGVVLFRFGLFAQVAMSCRVLGLDVETSVIHAIMRLKPCPEFYARVFETDANMVCRDLFLRCGFTAKADGSDLYVWTGGEIPETAAHLDLSCAFGDAAAVPVLLP